MLSGFDVNPQTLADNVGYDDVQTLKIGDPVGRHLSKKNLITWRYPFFNDDAWDMPVDRVIARLGGVDGLTTIIGNTRPQAAFLRLCVPSIGSPWQESGGLCHKTMADVVRIGLDFDIAVFHYDPANPTHGVRPAPSPLP